ncbi:MAG: hypothetical protein GF393_09015 [Armatimonadia bacterium]|nr:hypothetical protein [Armatimonadia bacterium]
MPPDYPIILPASPRSYLSIGWFIPSLGAVLLIAAPATSTWWPGVIGGVLVGIGAWQLLTSRNVATVLDREAISFLDWRGREVDRIRIGNPRRLEWHYDYSGGLKEFFFPGLALIEIHFSRDDGDPDAILVTYGGRSCHREARTFVDAILARSGLYPAPETETPAPDSGTRVWEREARDTEWLWSQVLLSESAMRVPTGHREAVVRVHHHALELPEVGSQRAATIPWRQITGLKWEGGLAPNYGFGGVKAEVEENGSRSWKLVAGGFGRNHARDAYRLALVMAARARLVRTEVKAYDMIWTRAELPADGGLRHASMGRGGAQDAS